MLTDQIHEAWCAFDRACDRSPFLSSDGQFEDGMAYLRMMAGQGHAGAATILNPGPDQGLVERVRIEMLP